MLRAACLLAAGAVWAPAAIPSTAAASDGIGVQLTIVDPAVTADAVATPAAASDPGLRAFAERLVKDLRHRLAESGARPARAVATVFRIPLVASGDAAFPDPPAAPEAEGAACSADSPWATLSVRRAGEGLTLEVLALWNERQALQDLAALERDAPQADASQGDASRNDAPLSDTAPRRPLTRSAFSAYAQAWSREAVMGEAPAPGDAPLEARLPADVAWLFARAPQATRGPFDLGAEAALRAMAPRLAEDQAALVGALAARCLAPDGNGGRFGGPHDIRTLAGPNFGESAGK